MVFAACCSDHALLCLEAIVMFTANDVFRLPFQGAAHKGIAAMIAVDIHGEVVCGGASDGSCTVWNLRTCREQARLTGHQQKVPQGILALCRVYTAVPCHVVTVKPDIESLMYCSVLTSYCWAQASATRFARFL